LVVSGVLDYAASGCILGLLLVGGLLDFPHNDALEGMSDDRTKADKAWEARQEAARYRIFNAATNAAEATDEADDENYFAVLDRAGNAAEAAAAEITGYKTYADLLEALDTRRKQS
jgi:hypothetical protein